MRMTADDIIARYCGHRIGHRSEPPMNLHACKYGLGCEGKGCSHDGCPRRADEQSAPATHKIDSDGPAYVEPPWKRDEQTASRNCCMDLTPEECAGVPLRHCDHADKR